MSETRTIKITAEDGLLIGNTFVPRNKTANVPKERAESLIRSKVAEAADGAKVNFDDPYRGPTEEELAAIKEANQERRETPASELADFPSYAALNKRGLTTVAGLKEFIEKNPNDWPTLLEVTADEAKAILKHGEKSTKGKKGETAPTTPPASETTEPPAAE